MRKLGFTVIASVMLVSAASCSYRTADPYAATLNTLSISVQYPEGYESFIREGISISVEDINLGNSYTLASDASGSVRFTVPDGLYRISSNDRVENDLFNGTRDKFPVSGGQCSTVLPMEHSKAGTIIIKEIYCGGCKRLPQEGNYQADKYVILHNNDVGVQYLDSLCFGTLFPYNSNQNNPFISYGADGEISYPDYAPMAQTVWQFGGDGKTFPLQPGEDAVLCLNGAVDHTQQYPLSVNLNKPEYFVCYNNTYFPNTTYHPAPGDKIRQDHILDAVVKTGIANAYTFSVTSPTALLFKAVGISMRDYAQKEGSIVQVPGSTSDQVTAIPYDWVLDAVEVFNGASSSNTKRLVPTLDAGYVTLSDSYLGHSLMRRVDEELTASSGYEVLADSNNSSLDFYELDKQSLHE